MTDYVFRNVTEALPALCKAVMAQPITKTRNGPAKELLYTNITLTHPLEREVLNPARGASYPAQIVETAWVLVGRHDIAGIMPYLPRAADFSDDGEVWRAGYGPRLRSWQNTTDQLREVIRLLREDDQSRRAVMSIFDPASDFRESKDIPCNNWVHFLVRDGKLHGHVAIRSNDLIWGWSGINQFEWSAILELIATQLALPVGELHFSISSLHVYEQHWKKAEAIIASRRGGEVLQSVFEDSINPAGFNYYEDLSSFDDQLDTFFAAEKAIRTRSIIPMLDDPLLSEWVNILEAWWNGERNPQYVAPRQKAALNLSLGRKGIAVSAEQEEFAIALESVSNGPMVRAINALHKEKHLQYGDSWKKRGEVGILSNIARKSDRLGKPGAGDSELDTAFDLLVYLLKYRVWLDEEDGVRPVGASDLTDGVETLLSELESGHNVPASVNKGASIDEDIRILVDNIVVGKLDSLNVAIALAYVYAERQWVKDGNKKRSFSYE